VKVLWVEDRRWIDPRWMEDLLKRKDSGVCLRMMTTLFEVEWRIEDMS